MGRGGGGGRAKYKKNIRARQNYMNKNSCTPINPKKYSCYGPKKIHARNLIMKKKSCPSKIPHPPHNFSDGPSLIINSANIDTQTVNPFLYNTFSVSTDP